MKNSSETWNNLIGRSEEQTRSWIAPSRMLAGITQLVPGSKYRWEGKKRKADPKKPFLAFQWTIDGHGVFQKRREMHLLPAGKAFMTIVPSDHVYFYPKDAPGWRFVFLLIHMQCVVERLAPLIDPSGSILNVSPASSLVTYALRIVQGLADGGLHDTLEAEHAQLTWMMEAERFLTAERYPERQRLVLLNELRERVRSNPGRRFSISELAAETAMSRSNYTHYFKKKTGLSPAAYVGRIRIEVAAERLLRDPRAPLKEIASETGFMDATHFSKAFYKHYRISPGAFRKQYA